MFLKEFSFSPLRLMFVAERAPDKSIFLIRTRAPFHLEEIAIQTEVVSTVSAVQPV